MVFWPFAYQSESISNSFSIPLGKEDQKYGEKLAILAKIHSSEAFIACDDPFEAAIFSVLIEIIKHQENRGCSSAIPDNEYPKDGVLSLKFWT